MDGYWERDNSHFPVPMSRYLWDLFLPAYDEGARQGLARYGCALDHFEFARVDGRLYVRLCFVSSLDELERRKRAAESALESKLWRQDRAAWPAIAGSLRRRLLGFARRDPSGMDLPELRSFVTALHEVFKEGTIRHFVQQPSSMVPVGDWVRRTCVWTGASPSEVIPVLQGFSRQAGDYLRSIGTVAAVLRKNDGAIALIRDQGLDARARMKQLERLSPEIAQAFADHLDEYSDRIVTGFDVTDATLRELPQFTLALVAAHIEPALPSADPQTRDGREAALRERVPAAHRQDFDLALREARAGYGLHDEDVRITYLWPLGLIRRALMAAAEKLAARGTLHSPEDIFQTTPSEADALMRGGAAPSANEIRGRVEEWQQWTVAQTEPAIGERETRFSDEELGPECARISSAITFYLGEMEACNRRVKPSWSLLVEGLAASPGRYQGRATIVCNPADFARLGPGDVLIARTTSPAYSAILPTLGAVVTDRGGSLCHAAIIAREFRIPAVVGTNTATTQIPDGAQVLVDGDRGFVAVLR